MMEVRITKQQSYRLIVVASKHASADQMSTILALAEALQTKVVDDASLSNEAESSLELGADTRHAAAAAFGVAGNVIWRQCSHVTQDDVKLVAQ